MLVLGLVPIPMVFLNVLGEVAAATVASGPAWLGAFGEPMMILWLVLVGARTKPLETPAALPA